MKFPTLTGEIVTVKVDQKQAWQCYTEILKVEPYPLVWELSKPNLSLGDSSQLMSVDEGFPIQILAFYEASMADQDDVLNVDLRDDTIEKGPEPIKGLVKLQLGPKPEQYTQLSSELTTHE